MPRTKKLALLTGTVICLCVGSVLLFAASRRSKIFDRYQVEGVTFKIRVSGYYQAFPFSLPGARYVFESAPINSENWQEIVTYDADQRIPLRKDQIHFVGDQIAYAYVAYYYMVTTNGGAKWFVWDANKELPTEEIMERYNLWPGVETVEMHSDGRGTMTLLPFISSRERGPKLHTSDYGHYWSLNPK